VDKNKDINPEVLEMLLSLIETKKMQEQLFALIYNLKDVEVFKEDYKRFKDEVVPALLQTQVPKKDMDSLQAEFVNFKAALGMRLENALSKLDAKEISKVFENHKYSLEKTHCDMRTLRNEFNEIKVEIKRNKTISERDADNFNCAAVNYSKRIAALEKFLEKPNKIKKATPGKKKKVPTKNLSKKKKNEPKAKK
jgi:hypothetical protein